MRIQTKSYPHSHARLSRKPTKTTVNPEKIYAITNLHNPRSTRPVRHHVRPVRSRCNLEKDCGGVAFRQQDRVQLRDHRRRNGGSTHRALMQSGQFTVMERQNMKDVIKEEISPTAAACKRRSPPKPANWSGRRFSSRHDHGIRVLEFGKPERDWLGGSGLATSIRKHTSV